MRPSGGCRTTVDDPVVCDVVAQLYGGGGPVGPCFVHGTNQDVAPPLAFIV
jgi:hypothetical protein